MRLTEVTRLHSGSRERQSRLESNSMGLGWKSMRPAVSIQLLQRLPKNVDAHLHRPSLFLQFIDLSNLGVRGL